MTHKPQIKSVLCIIKAPMIVRGHLTDILTRIEQEGFEITSTRLMKADAGMQEMLDLDQVHGLPDPAFVVVCRTDHADPIGTFRSVCEELDAQYGSQNYGFAPVRGADDSIYVAPNADTFTNDVLLLLSDELPWLHVIKPPEPRTATPTQTKLSMTWYLTHSKCGSPVPSADEDDLHRDLVETVTSVLDHGTGMDRIYAQMLALRDYHRTSSLAFEFAEEGNQSTRWMLSLDQSLILHVQIRHEHPDGTTHTFLPPAGVYRTEDILTALRLGATTKMAQNIKFPSSPEGQSTYWNGTTFVSVA